jgi:hypothetical protein
MYVHGNCSTKNFMVIFFSLLYQFYLFISCIIDKKLKFQFIDNFELFVKRNPGALWKPQALQLKLMEFNLGKRYWDNKLEQYRVMREDLGIKLV